MRNFLLMGLLIVLTSCGNSHTQQSGTEGGDAQPAATSDGVFVSIRPSSSGIVWEGNYSIVISEMLDESVISGLLDMTIDEHDLSRLNCIGFNKFSIDEKKEFFKAYLAAIAEAESDFQNDERTYNKSDRTMNIGLLQIDPASANRHAGKYFGRTFSANDLKNADWNLKVGMMILKNQLVSTNGRLFPESTYYWQVLSGKASRVINNFAESASTLCEEK